MASADADLAAVIVRQHGAFNLGDARAAGFSDGQVSRRVTSGRWQRATRGVLVVASSPATWQRAAMVALLARPHSTVSHLTAARALGLIDSTPLRPTLSVPTSESARSPVATIVRAAVRVDEATVIDGLRVTHATRTLLDLAPTVPTPLVRRMVDVALGRRLTSPEAIDRALASTASRSRHARETLMAAADVWRPAIRPGSVAEARLLRQLQEWGLAVPSRQVPVIDGEGVVVARIDVGWPSVRLGLEYDSLEWHGPARWAGDEARHAMITGLGWTVLHVDAGDLRPGSSLRARLEAWPGLMDDDRRRRRR